ncbi:MAG: biopolymer transporter ExbD, partial [Acidobacteriota bacterium]|nr:biopolymer transporter ExbD [Acidobacteriota bacterium]
MAMNISATAGVRSDINITPLVDVVLVLLIIFMIAVPTLQLGYEAQVPPKVETSAPPPDMNDQVIVRMDADGRSYINKTEVQLNDFPGQLRTAMRGRQAKVVFFAADGELPYDRVIDIMDICRNNGAENLGIVFDDLRQT